VCRVWLSGILALGMLAALSAGAQTTAAKPAPPIRHKPKVIKQAQTAKPADPPRPVPIPQMPLEQLPAQAPRVTYRNGQLTIDAQNATLGDVLTAVRRQTGAQIDVPPGGGSERVVVHLAGPARSVLSSLLDGSNLGYIIVGVPESPDKVAKVILSVLEKQASATAPGNSPGTSAAPDADPADSPDDGPPDAEVSEPPPAPPQPEPPRQTGANDTTPGQQPSNPYQGGTQNRSGRPVQAPPGVFPSPDPSQNPPPTRTPEQMLQDLQQMRQLQQQQQQQQQQ